MSEEHIFYFKVCGTISAKSREKAGDILFELLHDKMHPKFIRVSDEEIKGCRGLKEL